MSSLLCFHLVTLNCTRFFFILEYICTNSILPQRCSSKKYTRIVNNRFSFQNYFPTRRVHRRFAEVDVAEQMNSAASIHLKHARTSLQFLYLHLQTKSFPSHKFIWLEIARSKLKSMVVWLIRYRRIRYIKSYWKSWWLLL